MKKNLLFALLAVTFTFSLSAQQFENAGFEDWEDAGTVIDEPVDWSSIKTSDNSSINPFAPEVWAQTDDSHSGNFAVELFNVQSLLLATGTLTNGRVHAELVLDNGYVYTDQTDERWGTPLSGRPDSVAIWVKYFPQGTDTAQCKFVLHTGDGSIPAFPENEENRVAYAEINITGTIDTWTRVAAQFTYYNENNPEYILSILTAGAGYAPIEGSMVRYDDLELIYGPNEIGDVAKTDVFIYSSGNTIFLDKLPREHLNNASIDIFNLSGSVVYSAPLISNRVNINNRNHAEGLYLVHVYGRDADYTQKVFLK
jgi:hypothetical protein